MQKQIGFMVEEDLRHEETVQKHKKLRKVEDAQKGSMLAEFPACPVQNSLLVILLEFLKNLISVPAPRQTILHTSEIADGVVSTKCPPEPAHWRLSPADWRDNLVNGNCVKSHILYKDLVTHSPLG